MIKINGAEYRNLPQQVAKNANDIEEIKNDIEEIKADVVSIKLYSHNYSGAFRCTFNSNSYTGTFTLDCVSFNNGNGTTLADLKNMLSERGYYNTTITSNVPSSANIQSYGLRTNLSLREGSINPGYQYPASMFLHKDNIYITINTTDNDLGNGKVFKVEEQAFSMRHLVNEI